jgi:hypothetical protein
LGSSVSNMPGYKVNDQGLSLDHSSVQYQGLECMAVCVVCLSTREILLCIVSKFILVTVYQEMH